MNKKFKDFIFENSQPETAETLLIYAVINQIKEDMNIGFEALEELIRLLIKNPVSRDYLIGYLGDNELEDFRKGETKNPYL
jgi:hypothetical protein